MPSNRFRGEDVMPVPYGVADGRVLAWLHIGDLHMTQADAPNHGDLRRIVELANSLDAFHEVLGARPLPYAETIQGHRCLFLDVVSAGSGGPDFRLDEAQLTWTERETKTAEDAGQNVVIFMHTYPADLREGAGRLMALVARPNVVCVDMGHTHYNELANDGRTIFMATRSTGQIEEGRVGFSLAASLAGASSRWTIAGRW
jgi:hypothetical protein